MAIHSHLIRPESIVVVGGTDNLQAPGGRILKNLLDHGYRGKIFVVNPKKTQVQGIKAYPSVDLLPDNVDLAIIAVAAKYTEEIVRILTEEKGTRGFIIISAGFGDTGPEGKALEERLVKQIEKFGGSLLGPNNIGLINTHYAGVFTTPVPALSPDGVDLISGSGATAVFIMEAAMPLGLRFNSVWSVGNAAQTGIEEVLEYLDGQYENAGGRTILIYAESIRRPAKWLRHARSLVKKGAKIIAVKAGTSRAGSRAAGSHTGAMASPDTAVDALFRKSGILRTYGRLDLIYRAGVSRFKPPSGRKVVIVTHAGGPAVMLTDTLEKHGVEVPEIKHEKAMELQEQVLYPGASVKNPIDILATGTAEQLEKSIQYAVEYFEADMVPVIFGSPGLFPVDEAYEVIAKAIEQYEVPVYPVMPSLINTKREMERFRKKGYFHFTDEVLFGRALGDTLNQVPLFEMPEQMDEQLRQKFLSVISGQQGFLDTDAVNRLMDLAGIPVPPQKIVNQAEELASVSGSWFPVVMKVTGPVHKTEKGGVVLNVASIEQARVVFEKLMHIEGAGGVLVQKQLDRSLEMFAGLKYEEGFGHLLLFGEGGTAVEIRKDFQQILAPAGEEEIRYYLKKLNIYPLLQGYRNQAGADIDGLVKMLEKLSILAVNLPEIKEMDLNPVLFDGGTPVAVDVRVRV